MKKIGSIIVIALVFLLVVLTFAKNMIAKAAVSASVETMTGLKLSMGRMNVGIAKTLIDIEELKLFNPSDFEDAVMVDMPQIYVDYDLGAFLKRKVHLQEVRIYLKEFVVARNEKGSLNLDSLKAVQAKKEEEMPEKKKGKVRMPEFRVDALELKIDKVIFKDYSQGTPPRVREFNVNIDERYENITDAYGFVSLVVAKALMKTTIAGLANFDLDALKGEATDILKRAKEMQKEAAEKNIRIW